jgi:phage tail-like protein
MPGRVAGPVEDQQLVGSWFMVEIPKLTIQNLTEVGGLAIEMGVVETAQANEKGDIVIKKIPGVVQFSEITLKRQLTADKSMWTWVKEVRDKKAYRCDGSIVMYDTAGTEVSRWNFTNGWPSKWSASDLDAGSDDPIMEELTIQIEMLQRVS